MNTTEKVSVPRFVPQTVESAPEPSRPILQNVKKAFGFIQVRLLHSRSFHHRQRISIRVGGGRLGNSERYADCEQEDQGAGQSYARNCSGTGFRETGDDRSFSERLLSQGARHGTSMGVALKTISNYLDHISPTALDQAFEEEKVR